MGTLDNFGTNKELEVDGIWEDIGHGMSIRVARINNPAYRAYIRKETMRAARRVRGSAIPMEKQDEIQRKGAARHLLKDWKGNKDDDGNEIPYTAAAAEEALAKYPNLLNIVESIAADDEMFVEEAKGN